MLATPFKKLLTEPLAQFIALGALLFCLNLWFGTNPNDPKQIVINDARIEELATIFIEGQGREPTSEELQRMVIKWAQNEIFYREALAMDLDQGDEMIRSRMVLKLRNVLFNSALVDEPTDGELQQYYQLNHAAYNLPARYDVEQFAVNNSNLDSAGSPAALAKQLADQNLDERNNVRLMRYVMRPEANIENVFGKANAQQLLNAPVSQWQWLQINGEDILARVTKSYPAEDLALTEVKGAVLRDWRKLAADYNLAQQAQTIARKYSVQMQLSAAKSDLFKSDDAIFTAPEQALGGTLSASTTDAQLNPRVSISD